MKKETAKQESLIYKNALNLLSFIGAKRIITLQDYFGSAKEAWEAPVSEFAEILKLKKDQSIINKEKEQIDPLSEWQRLEESDICCVDIDCEEYPGLLKEIPFPPPILYYCGNLNLSGKPAIAIVGSRRCTFYGKEMADKLGRDLAVEEVTVVSGMALGIDTAAHLGALSVNGFTVAVLGCSLDKCYPPQNKPLMAEIKRKGLLLSEYPLGTEPLPMHFPQRNRIISGLSLATVVIEATMKSGALITADFALEQNREVFAVPGNVGSPYSQGCHRLIKEGAGLVESASDVLDTLLLSYNDEQQLCLDVERQPLSEAEQHLLNCISYQPVHMDRIIQQCGKKASESSAILLSLELKKYVRQTTGKYFSRI